MPDRRNLFLPFLHQVFSEQVAIFETFGPKGVFIYMDFSIVPTFPYKDFTDNKSQSSCASKSKSKNKTRTII